MTLAYHCSSCGELLETTNADPLNHQMDALVEVLREVIDETAFYQARFTSKEWRAKARAMLSAVGGKQLP